MLAAALVAAGPALLSRPPLAGLLLDRALPGTGYRFASRQVSLAWFGGQALAGATLTDPAGQVLLTVERASVDRSLLDLLTGQTRRGRLQLVRPVLQVSTRPGGSNVEDLFRALQKAIKGPAKKRPTAELTVAGGRLDWQVVVTEGQVRGADQATGAGWTVNDLAVEWDTLAAEEGGLQVTGSGRLLALPAAAATGSQHPGQRAATSRAALPGASPAEPEGPFKFRLHPGAAGRQQLEVVADRLRLVSLAPWLARLIPEVQMAGEVSLDGSLAWWQTAGGHWAWQTGGQLKASQVEYRGNPLQDDLLRCPHLDAAWQLACGPSGLEVGQLDAHTEWAKLTARGPFAWRAADPARSGLQTGKMAPAGPAAVQPEIDPSNPAAPVAAPDAPGSAPPYLQVRLDVARLAAMLPSTLRIRRGVRVESGRLTLTIRGKGATAAAHREDRNWTVRLALENLIASAGTHRIAWQEPVQATLDLVGPPLDFSRLATRIPRASIQAPFLQARWQVTARAAAAAVADPARVDGQFSFDLERLASQVGQLVDLSGWQMAGQGRGQFSLRGLAEDRFDASANLELERLLLGGQNSPQSNPRWSEPRLRITLQGHGTSHRWSPHQITAATIGIRAAAASGAPAGVPLAAVARAEDTAAADALELELLKPVDLHSAQPSLLLQVAGSGALRRWAVRLRPWLGALADRLEGAARWSARVRIDSERIEATEAQFQAAPLKFATESLRIDEPQARLSGDFHWDRHTGQVTSQRSECLTSTLAWRARDLRWDTGPTAQPAGEGRLAFRLDFRRLAAALRQPLPPALAASSTNQQATGQMQLRTTGGRRLAEVSLDYDWDALAGFLGPEVRLHGADRATFQLTGAAHDPRQATQQPRAWSRRWQMTADVGWQSASVYGLPLGGARWQAELAAGQLRSEPLRVTVGKEGRLTAQPQVRLDPQPWLLTIPAGPLLTGVTLSPEVSENILKYIAPVLAGATRTTGTFSLSLDKGRIPLDTPSLANLIGRLAIDHLSVAPGPTTEPLVALVRQIEALIRRRPPGSAQDAGRGRITIDRRTIEFRLAQGRVHHRGLEFLVDGVPIRSSGSVGLDQTLDVTLEVPILDRWVRQRRALQPLAGQVLTIPLGGTFQRPRIDQRVVADLSARLLQGTAERALGDELNRQLEKLFRRK